MPIVYIHGVNVRNQEYWPALEAMIRLYIAPVISKEPETVKISHCYWGDVGAYFRFQGASMPASPMQDWSHNLKGRLKNDLAIVKEEVARGRVNLKKIKSTLKQRKDRIIARSSSKLLDRLQRDGLSDLALKVIAATNSMSHDEKSLAMQAADEAAADLADAPELENCQSVEEELTVFQKLLREKYARLRKLKNLPELTQKPEWLNSLNTRLLEGVDRYADVPGFIMTRAAAEVRSPINTMVTAFIGDVFTYIRERGDWKAPGPIPVRALDALLEAARQQAEKYADDLEQYERDINNGVSRDEPKKEPLVVLSHSMGGQITYDIVTHFLPNLEGNSKYRDIYIDFWCASASQVGFFEELKLFLASDEKYSAKTGRRVPMPDKKYLGYWWNVWDYNDFISYSARNIFDEVEDDFYNTGMFLADAHGGYLVRPSFFRQFADKLDLELGKAGL